MLKYTQLHETKPLTSGQQATLTVSTGGKIQSMMLLFSDSSGDPVTEAQIRAEIGNIRVTFGGREIINNSANKLLDLYEVLGNQVFNAAAAPAGAMELNIGRLVFNSTDLRDGFGLGTADSGNIQVQITAGTLSAIASAQTVTSRTAQNENLGVHCEFKNYPQSFTAAGEHTVDTLPRNINSAYLALLVDDGASGVITHSEIRSNSNTLREKLSKSVNSLMLSEDRYSQPTGYFVHAFMDGSGGGMLPMTGVTDFRCITTFTTGAGAGGYNISPLTVVYPNKA